MRRTLLTVYFLLLTSIFLLLSCNSQTPQLPPQSRLFIYRLNPPALIEFSESLQTRHEIPFSMPPECGLLNLFPPAIGGFLSIELSCPNGQTVLFLDTDTEAVTQPIKDTDSHFLAWDRNGKAAYLKVDSLGSAHIARVDTAGRNETFPISQFTYDLAPNPKNNDFTFTFSRGLGQGSELWLAKRGGQVVQQLYVDPLNYISFARYSPDGRWIAFIKVPDTQIPFTVGELWVMEADGSNRHKLADADAGHGYAANWSPDGKRIAFVVRTNPDDQRANQSVEALISNIYLVDVESGSLTQVTHLQKGQVETPIWSPDGNTLAFAEVINDRMEIQIVEIGRLVSNGSGDLTGEIRTLTTESTCCPAWMRK